MNTQSNNITTPIQRFYFIHQLSKFYVKIIAMSFATHSLQRYVSLFKMTMICWPSLQFPATKFWVVRIRKCQPAVLRVKVVNTIIIISFAYSLIEQFRCVIKWWRRFFKYVSFPAQASWLKAKSALFNAKQAPGAWLASLYFSYFRPCTGAFSAVHSFNVEVQIPMLSPPHNFFFHRSETTQHTRLSLVYS
jgi:hypothetical protein